MLFAVVRIVAMFDDGDPSIISDLLHPPCIDFSEIVSVSSSDDDEEDEDDDDDDDGSR